MLMMYAGKLIQQTSPAITRWSGMQSLINMSADPSIAKSGIRSVHNHNLMFVILVENMICM